MSAVALRHARPVVDLIEASEPIETGGLSRDEVRLLAAFGDGRLVHTRFRDLPELLAPGDLLVVNTSATLPAALDAVDEHGLTLGVHLATRLPGDLWLAELRLPQPGGATGPWDGRAVGLTLELPGGARAELLTPFSRTAPRLWFVSLSLPAPLVPYLHRHGRPVRYGYVKRDWPLSAYQTVFAREPGSAEMPSAARPFTTRLVTQLVARGIGLAPLVLHTGVSSPEAHEPPYPERYEVPEPTARQVNETRAAGGRVVAVGTTVVRALETVVDRHHLAHPGAGWTEVVIGPERGVSAVDGLITGWHEAAASHLDLLEAVGGPELVARSYGEADAHGYRRHEFGDSHLLLP